MTEPQTTLTKPQPPILASPARQVLHTLVAVAGWVLFIWWWWIVIRSVSSEAVRFTMLFLLLTTVVVVLITSVWAIHNRLIFKRRGPRTQVREVAEDFSRDRLGRSVHFAESLDSLRNQPIVLIRLEHQGKVYRSTHRVPSRILNGAAVADDNGAERG